MWPASFVETDILKILKKTLSQVTELIQQIKVVATKPRNLVQSSNMQKSIDFYKLSS